jgi:hypothetical protein
VRVEIGHKRCPDCGEVKPAAAYRRNKSRPDGLAFYCEDCFKRRDSAGYRRRMAERGRTVRERISVPNAVHPTETGRPHQAARHRPETKPCRHQGRSSHLAVPRPQPRKPAVVSGFGRKLREHGIDVRPARNAAIIALINDLPAPILADLFDLHPITTDRWAYIAKRDWTGYLASRAQDTPR